MLNVYDSPVGIAGLKALLGEGELQEVGSDDLKTANFVDGLIVRLYAAGNDRNLGVSIKEIHALVAQCDGALLVLTETTDFDTYARLYGSGVQYALPYCSPPEELCRVIGAMKQKSPIQGYLSSVKRRLENPLLGAVAENLSVREQQVSAAIAVGLTNKQIAKIFGISYETVKEHVQHVLRKLDCSDRTQVAVKIARRWNPTLSL